MKEILPISDIFDQPEDNEPTETKLSKAVAELLGGINNDMSSVAISKQFLFTPENLLDNLDKLGAWSAYCLASEALRHYFPDAYAQNPCYVQCGDNLELLKSQPNESVNMIYCDILYGTGRNFGDYQDLKPIRSEIESHYLPRLIEMKRVLKQNGSIYLQMDCKISHWMRCLMDDVFGYSNFKNEIIWYYMNKIPDTRKKMFTQSNDVILFYAMCNYTFNTIEDARAKPIVVSKIKKVNGKKIYVKDDDGKGMYEVRDSRVADSIVNIPMLHCQPERTGYATQKPKELISRFVLASTNEGDTVADYYLGSGTTCEAALELGRKFIGCDINPRAIEITKERIKRFL